MATIIRRGNPVYVLYSVKDKTKYPPRPLEPDGSVTITITDPNSSIIMQDALMSRASKGQFYVVWQSLVNSPIGNYTGEVAVTHAGRTSRSFSETIFILQDAP